jgi:hypothetical protein
MKGYFMFPSLPAISRPNAPQNIVSSPIQFGKQALKAEYEKIQQSLASQGLQDYVQQLDPKLSFVQNCSSYWRMLKLSLSQKQCHKEMFQIVSSLLEQSPMSNTNSWGVIQSIWPTERTADGFVAGINQGWQVPANVPIGMRNLRPTPTEVLTLIYRRGSFPEDFVPPSAPKSSSILA